MICISSILLGNKEWLLVFPFIPVQITLFDQFVEGFPPFVLTFERNIRPVEPKFLKKAIFKALPSGLMVVFSVLFVRIFGSHNGWSSLDISTVSYYLLGTIGFLSVARACIPLNLWRILLIIWSIGGFFGTAYLLRDFIEIGTLTSQTAPVFLCLAIIFAMVFTLSNHIQRQREK